MPASSQFRLTRPCESCPFRTDKPFYLAPGRAREIADALEDDQTFHCHKTIDYGREDDVDDEWDDDGEDRLRVPGEQEAHCAGALIVLEKMDRPNQMMRIFERIGGYDRTKLDMNAPVPDTLDEWVEFIESVDRGIRSPAGQTA